MLATYETKAEMLTAKLAYVKVHCAREVEEVERELKGAV